MHQLQKIFIVLVISVLPKAMTAVENDMVIAQMNTCVNTLTNIINNKSMTVLEHETDQLLNNLTIEQIVGIPEIAYFRGELIDKIGKLGITEEERNILRKINAIQHDNHKWQSISSAMGNTMLITGGGDIGYQTAFQALLLGARAVVEYKTSSNEMDIEELKAMWKLRKDDLNEIIELRKEALEIIFKLYQRFNLKESDRLTEQSSLQFQKIITTPDPKTMVRLLKDNKAKFGHMADYYYYLGMGYLDSGQKNNALAAFKRYEDIYNAAPIYRQDEKSGLISLARLANFKLSAEETEREIHNALKNLPSNNSAIIQCALIYQNTLKQPAKALSIIRQALDNPSIADKTDIAITGSFILPLVSNKNATYNEFIAAYNNQPQFDINTLLNVNRGCNINLLNSLSKIVKFNNISDSKGLFQATAFNEDFELSLPSKFSINPSLVSIVVEAQDGDKINITKHHLENKNLIPLDKINKKKVFKDNPELKYLYMSEVSKDQFVTKLNLDYLSIQNHSFPRQDKFVLTEKERKEIVKFLKENSPRTTRNEYNVVKDKEKKKPIEKIKNAFKVTSSAVLNYIPDYAAYDYVMNKTENKSRTLLKFIFDNPRQIELCYKFDPDKKELVPCYYKVDGKRYFANKTVMKEFGISNSSKSVARPTVQKPASTTKKKEVKKTATPQPKKDVSPTKNKAKKNDASQEKKDDKKSWWKVW